MTIDDPGHTHSVTPQNHEPINFAKLAQSYKTNEQKMLECLQGIQADMRELLKLIISELPLNALKPEDLARQQDATSAPRNDVPSPKMFVGKPRAGKR
jgi:hypothetical protein